MKSVRFGVAAILLCGIIVLIARMQVMDLVTRVTFLTGQQELIGVQLIELQQLREVLLDLESGERGFLLTGDETYLDSYPANLRDFEVALTRTRNVVSPQSGCPCAGQ